MKLLFSSPSPPEVGSLKALLDEAGIPTEIRNETIYQNIPGAAFQPEIWVLNDNDYPAAREVLEAWRQSVTAETSDDDLKSRKPPDYSGSVGCAFGALLFFGGALIAQKKFAQSRETDYALFMVCMLLVSAAFVWLAFVTWPGNKAK